MSPTAEDNTPQEVGAQPSVRLRSQECIRHEEECSRRLERVEGALKTQEEAMIEHRLRLENGSRVFTDIKAEISGLRTEMKEVAKASAPKPVDWWRIVVPVSGLLITLLTAWWALSSQLSERPTEAEMEKVLRAHTESVGHPSMATEVRQVRDEQIKQGEALKSLTEKFDQTRTDVQDIKADIRAMRGSRPGSTPQQP